MKPIKFARYPSCFGKLDCQGIYDVALKHGMEVISCHKPDMHCYNEVGLYGTREQMAAVEKEWTANGNELKRNARPPLVFGVDLDRPRKDWVSVKLALAQREGLAPGDSQRRARTAHGQEVIIPQGWRILRAAELPTTDDVAWHDGVKKFTPIKADDLEYWGPKSFKKNAHLILRLARTARFKAKAAIDAVAAKEAA